MKLLVKRFISFIIDYIVTSGLVSLFYYFAQVFYLNEETVKKGELMLICALASIFIFTIYLPVNNHGQTLGEKAMNIYIRNKNGKERTYFQCFLRECVLKFGFGPIFFIFTSIYFVIYNVVLRKDIYAELPHDALLKTYVE